MSVLFLHHPKETDLALFAGGELGPLARWRIERHIQTCTECEEAVADFFHLQGDVSELAELPPVDWAALSLNVRQAVAEARCKPEPVKGGIWHRPLVWQAGLASAALFCAFVVARQYSIQPGKSVALLETQPSELATPRAEAPSAATAPNTFRGANRERAAGEELAEQRKDSDALAKPGAPARGGATGVSNFARADDKTPSSTAERDVGYSALPGDVGVRATPGRPVAQNSFAEPSAVNAVASESAAKKAEESPSNTLALARRNAPQPAPSPARKVASNEREAAAESFRGRAGQYAQSGAAAPTALRAALKAPEAEALADRVAVGESVSAPTAGVTGGKLRQTMAPTAGPGFSVPDNISGGRQAGATVSADGGISYRSVDSRTGTITIYDVYAP